MPILFTRNNETGHIKLDQGDVSFILYSLITLSIFSIYISVFQQLEIFVHCLIKVSIGLYEGHLESS